MTALSGPLIGSVFGLIFVLANAGWLPEPVGAMLRGIAFAVFVAIVLTLRRRAGRPSAQARASGPVFASGFWMVVAGELGAIAAGLVVLNGPLDVPRAGVAWISLVVGLHFVALAITVCRPSLHALGTAVTTCGAAGLVLAATGASDAAIATIAGVLPGVLLLGTGVRGATGDPDRAGPPLGRRRVRSSEMAIGRPRRLAILAPRSRACSAPRARSRRCTSDPTRRPTSPRPARPGR